MEIELLSGAEALFLKRKKIVDINELLKVGLPFIAAIVSYALQRDNLDPKTNTIIAGATVLIAAFGDLFLTGKLTGNPYADFALIATTAAALQADSFASLQQWLRSNFAFTGKKKE